MPVAPTLVMAIDMGTALIGGLIAGVVCGLVPLIYGAYRNRLTLGIVGFAACVASGLVLGLILALPVAAIMTYLIYRSLRRGGAGTTAADTTP